MMLIFTRIRRFFAVLLTLGAIAIPLAPLSAATLSSQFATLASAQKLALAKQSVCIQGPDGTVVSRNANAIVIPASVSKLYVFDWALSKLPVDYRYTTDFYVKGKTLYINGGGDPHFVIEHLRDTIRSVHEQQGITINKIVFSPNFYFNWKTAPADVTAALIASLQETQQLDATFPLATAFTVSASTTAYGGSGTHYQFQSMPLLSLMKQINDYSTNISADTLFKKLGGAEAFALYMQQTYGAGTATVHFINGSGLPGNYTTCALTLRVIKHLEQELTQRGHVLTDVMTVPTVDPGVLGKRHLNPSDAQAVVAKSGTVDYHQSLAGVINTKRGSEYFGIFTTFTSISKTSAIKSMIDDFLSAVLLQQRSSLKPYAYTPDPDAFTGYRIVRK